jgi:5'-deoxynucleotidase YfbR-like HD superfamily hydrolase
MRQAHALLNLLRSGGTQRYHTHAARMIKTQDVAQHTYNLLLILSSLTFHKASGALWLAALTHDAGEHWTGDMPSPTKRANNLRNIMDALERVALESYAEFKPPELSPGEAGVLKLADALEGALRCLHEAAMGNRLIDEVATNFRAYVEEALKELPTIEADQKLEFNWALLDQLCLYIKGKEIFL